MMPKFITYGGRAILADFGNKINLKINASVHNFDRLIMSKKIKGIIETIPAYSSLTIIYDPEVLNANLLIKKLKSIWKQSKNSDTFSTKKSIEIPVMYGGEYGPDMSFVAKYSGLSTNEVIKIHTSADYIVYMVGFTPGFAYLGGMSLKIATPRLSTPRKSVPKGSVGIGGNQTGIYPVESPGGWQIIGRTPLELFDIHKDPPVLLKPGMRVKFIQINEDEYERLKNEKHND
jgi:inhibitor of KinA